MKIRIKSLAALLGALVLGSTAAAADDNQVELRPSRVALTQGAGEPVTVVNVPPGDSADTYTTWNAPLFASGAVLFGASYGAAAIAASQSDNDADDRLWVPIAGPWLDLSDRSDCNLENVACDGETTTKVLLVGDGILQGAGALMMVGSLVLPRTVTRSQPAMALRHVKSFRTADGGRGFAYGSSF